MKKTKRIRKDFYLKSDELSKKLGIGRILNLIYYTSNKTIAITTQKRNGIDTFKQIKYEYSEKEFCRKLKIPWKIIDINSHFGGFLNVTWTYQIMTYKELK